jgi:hypothetical protein
MAIVLHPHHSPEASQPEHHEAVRTAWYWACVALCAVVSASMLVFLLKPFM